jgi:hypothetical protein
MNINSASQDMLNFDQKVYLAAVHTEMLDKITILNKPDIVMNTSSE